MKEENTDSLEAVRSKGYLRGFGRIADTELLALVMGRLGARSSVSLAHELFDRYGDLVGLGRARIEELLSFPGIGKAGAFRLKASFELGRRSLVEGMEREVRKVRCPEDVASLLAPEMKDLDREFFKAVLLNTKNGILKIVTVAIGSLNAALVHPREIFKEAVVASAAGIIIVHNHPTGNPEPSREDADLTVRFTRCGELMGIDLVDHIIIGSDGFVSMRERGLVTS